MDALFAKGDLAEYVEQDNILLACQVADNTPVVEWSGYVVSLDERFIVLRTTGKVMVTDSARVSRWTRARRSRRR